MEQQGNGQQPSEFEVVKARLEEIAQTVDDENLSLDEALDLYEEAVKLGLQASDLLAAGIVVEDEPDPEVSTTAPEDASTDKQASGSQEPDGRGALRAPGSPQANSDNAANLATAVNQD